MKKVIQTVLLPFIFYINLVNAQNSSVSDNTNSVRNFENYIINHYHPDKHQIDTICENSCIFIRFKILKNGEIGNLEFSRNTIGFSPNIKSTPPAIIDALTDAFKSNSIHLVLSKELRSDSKTYLLPFIYYYNAGCYVLRKHENEKLSKIGDTTYKSADEEQLESAILNMLNFSDKSFNTQNYTILNPIKVGEKDRRLFY